jgi:Cu-processing system permease protein
MSSFLIIVRTVWTEYIRSKDFFVVLILMSLFALGAVVARVIGVKTAAEAQFLMSFGLSMAYLLSGVLTVALSSRQLPREFENRTLYPLLARPLSRGIFLLGKVTGVALLGTLTLLVLTLLSFLPTPKDPAQTLAGLGRLLALQSLALFLLAVLTTAFSLYMPPVVAMLLSLGCFFLGGPLINALGFALARAPALLSAAVDRLLTLVPDFSVFNHISRFADGHAGIGAADLLHLAGYALALSFAWIAFAAWSLARRQL